MDFRDLTPLVEDCTDKLRADAQRYYDKLVALGGRPTRPMKQYPDCNTTTTENSTQYREDYERIEAILEVDKDRSSSHWAEEMSKWDHELLHWERFKDAQRIHNQYGRYEVDLELENTDAALVGVLYKLNDWQEFQSLHCRRVHEAERSMERCQQGLARSHNAVVAATNADAMLDIKEPMGGWIGLMRQAQERFEASQNELKWVKGQWTEVIAEACSSIATEPKLQEQLEAKFEKRVKAIYRILQQKGARPSFAVYPPKRDAGFAQRLWHWISEGSALFAELSEWKAFLSWRRQVKDDGNTDREGRRMLSVGDSCSELFEDHVEYQQYELDKAISWVNSWRRQATRYKEAYERVWRYYGRRTLGSGSRWLHCERVDDDDDDEDTEDGYEDDEDDDSDAAQARRAEVYAMRAEEKVSIATKRLEQSKQKLQSVLAELVLPATNETPAVQPTTQLLPAPPTSHSSQSPSNRRRPSEQKGLSGKGPRRLKKERVRKVKAKTASIDTEQHALPQFPLGSNALKDHDDVEMSDVAEDSSPIEINEDLIDSEDTAMFDIEERPHDTPPSSPPSLPPSSPQSYPKPASDKCYKNTPSPKSPCPTSRKTRSATKLDQVPSGRVLKNTSKNKPRKKAKDFTGTQTKALLDAASTATPPTNLPSLGRNTPEPYTNPTAPSTTNNEESPPTQSPTLQVSIPRKTRSATNLEQASGKIFKKSKQRSR